jgi:hypothetical protein
MTPHERTVDREPRDQGEVPEDVRVPDEEPDRSVERKVVRPIRQSQDVQRGDRDGGANPGGALAGPEDDARCRHDPDGVMDP